MPSTEQQTTIVISGLCCAAEENTVRKKLSALEGVQDLSFNLVTHKLQVRHSCNETLIIDSLSDIGLPGYVEQGRVQDTTPKTPSYLLYSTIASGLLFGVGLLSSALGIAGPIAMGAFLASILIGGWRVAIKAYKSVRNGSLDMNFLMTIAVLGALGIGQMAEASAVMFLFALSLLLESMSIDRTRNAIRSLMKLSPTTATVRRNGTEVIVPVSAVSVGETIIVRPGERIPLDGVVTGGHSAVDQSAITGEWIPVSKLVGAEVYAGSFNQKGSLEIRATRPASDSTLARIMHLVEEAQTQKAPTQSFIERFARWYTPGVFLLALSVAILPPLVFGWPFSDWFYRALVLLVIACPCALVISTPVSIVSALTRAARDGVLIKGGKHLEELSRIQAVAFDKTGTLTLGTPTVTDILGVDSLAPDSILRIAAAIESRSEHHLADALLRKAEEERIDLSTMRVESFHAITGKGVKAVIDGTEYVVGNHPLVEELGLCSPELEAILFSLERQGKTVVILSDETKALGVIAIADTLREESRHTVEELHRLGVRHSILLTGDNRGTALAAAEQLKVVEVLSELMPEDKLQAIQDLRKRFGPVAMVGDGVNDAPALAAADVGIAMGGVGSDTALETADVVLMSDNLAKIPFLFHLGKRTLSVIRQNIAIALATKAFFLILGILGMTSLWLAILADDGATLVVVLNGLRLLRTSREEQVPIL